LLTDLLFRKKLLKITESRVNKWIADRNERMLLFTFERELFALRIKALEGLLAIDYPDIRSLLIKAVDDSVESVSLLAIGLLRRSTDNPEIHKRIEEKLAFWERRKTHMDWAASQPRSYPYFDGGSSKESPGDRLMGQLRDQMRNNHPPF